ncbi:MAG: glycosyltransferase, partial [Acidobacteria bacterium]|nr:glycosyltransferase [Acidobacteriota bacterium]
FARDAGRRDEARRALGLVAGDEAVGTVVVLDRDRRVHGLLEAMVRLRRDRPAARLVVIGDGAGRRALEGAALSLGLDRGAVFTGWREDVPSLLQALDVYVYPGEGGEVFPVSLIEAMAAGLPVVVSDQPGIREIIENGKQGLFVPERGSEAMARTIHRVLADRAEADKLARAGAVRVQRFHTQAMIDAHEALYYRVSKIPREG